MIEIIKTDLATKLMLSVLSATVVLSVYIVATI